MKLRVRTGARIDWMLSGLSDAGVRVLFTGSSDATAPDALRNVESKSPDASWLRQVHGRRVLEATAPGETGEGDAQITDRSGLALVVLTADCVPVLLVAGAEIAAVHAGWRGIEAGVIPETIRRLAASPGDLAAWIGPAIGSCCYEVGGGVAERVAASTSTGCVQARPKGRPHIDLQLAVRCQLERAGMQPTQIRVIGMCTRCNELLASYRRDGRTERRNLSYVWKSAPPRESDRSRWSGES